MCIRIHIYVCVKLYTWFLSEKPLVNYFMKLYVSVIKVNRKLINFSIKDELVQRH